MAEVFASGDSQPEDPSSSDSAVTDFLKSSPSGRRPPTCYSDDPDSEINSKKNLKPDYRVGGGAA